MWQVVAFVTREGRLVFTDKRFVRYIRRAFTNSLPFYWVVKRREVMDVNGDWRRYYTMKVFPLK